MNRRELIVGTAAAGAVASLASLPAFSSPVRGIIAHPRITYADRAALNPHAEMAARQCLDLIEQGVIYARNGEFGYKVKLTDPKFHIVAGKPIWNWMTGYTNETGVAIFMTERGIPLGHVGIATNKGYEAYMGHPPERPLPDYFVRALWLNYEDMKLIEPHLPAGHVDLDMRWMENYQKSVAKA